MSLNKHSKKTRDGARSRALDNGAEGIIIPCLKSMDDFRKVVDLGKFAPLGNRGFIKGRGSGFGNEPWAYQVGSTRLSSGRQWTGYSVRANMPANSA